MALQADWEQQQRQHLHQRQHLRQHQHQQRISTSTSSTAMEDSAVMTEMIPPSGYSNPGEAKLLARQELVQALVKECPEAAFLSS